MLKTRKFHSTYDGSYVKGYCPGAMANDRSINFAPNELKNLLALAPADFLFQAQILLEKQGSLEIGKSFLNAEFSVTEEKVALLKASTVIKPGQETSLSYGIKSYCYNSLDKLLKNNFTGCPAKLAKCFQVFLKNVLINIPKHVIY